MLKKWIKNPLQFGSVRDSSAGLAQLLINQIPINPKYIVEFGAGSGPITAALSKEYQNSQIYSFELDADLSERVKKRVPTVTVVNSDVLNARKHLPAEVIGNVDAVISSLPLLNISEDVNFQIMESAFSLLNERGVFVQFTYLPFLPPTRVYKKLGLWAQFRGVELQNLPPAFVWVFKKI